MTGGEDEPCARAWRSIRGPRGAGDEVTGSAVEGLSGEDQVVAGAELMGISSRRCVMAEATGRARPQGLAGPSARYTEPPARAEGEGGTGSEPVPGQVLRSERAHFHEKLREEHQIGLSYTWSTGAPEVVW